MGPFPYFYCGRQMFSCRHREDYMMEQCRMEQCMTLKVLRIRMLGTRCNHIPFPSLFPCFCEVQMFCHRHTQMMEHRIQTLELRNLTLVLRNLSWEQCSHSHSYTLSLSFSFSLIWNVLLL